MTYPAGYRRPTPRSPWAGQLPVAVLGVVVVLAYLIWTAGAR